MIFRSLRSHSVVRRWLVSSTCGPSSPGITFDDTLVDRNADDSLNLAHSQWQANTRHRALSKHSHSGANTMAEGRGIVVTRIKSWVAVSLASTGQH